MEEDIWALEDCFEEVFEEYATQDNSSQWPTNVLVSGWQHGQVRAKGAS
jgi:hypothetical protein